MPIINTKSIFLKDGNRKNDVLKLTSHIFTEIPDEAIYFELLQLGLLKRGSIQLDFDPWGILQNQLLELKKAWNGPDVDVFIFPAANGLIKNGVAYKNGICLFISKKVNLIDCKALLAHEYNHICRRQFIKEPPTLLESVIIEGLAESAVHDLFGEEAISPWTKQFSLKEAKALWEKHFIPSLNVRGLHRHYEFLYGDESLGLPKWIGYSIGFRIVDTFQQIKGPIHLKELLQMDAAQIVEGAGFTLN